MNIAHKYHPFKLRQATMPGETATATESNNPIVPKMSFNNFSILLFVCAFWDWNGLQGVI